MKKLFFLILLIFLTFNLEAQNHFSYTHYTSDDGLSQNSISAMMKDSKGYLWFGTRDGLNKFDGYNFTIFNSKPNKRIDLLSNRIIDIKEDKWGYIWVKTYDEIVFRLNPNTEEMMRIESPEGGFINEKINELYILPSGSIWLTTFDKGCYRINTDEISHELTVSYFNKKNNLLSNNSVQKVIEDSEKNTWILTLKGLNCIYPSGKSAIYFNNQSFYSSVENSKRIMFGSNSKVFQYEKRNKTFKLIDFPGKLTVTSIASFTPNNYIFATQEMGFYTFDIIRETLQQFSKEKYPEMKTNEIQSIYIDRAGEAWLGIRSSGVLHFTAQNNKIEYISSKMNEGQYTNPNFLIFEDEKDVLWIQPYYGSFSWYDRVQNKLISFYSAYNDEINTLFSYGVNHVLSDSQGVLWISTNRGNGFFKCTFLPDYFNHYLIDNHSVYSISNETRSIFEDNEKRLWVACKDEAIHVYDKYKKVIGTLNSDGRIIPGGKLEIPVYNFFQDKDNNIWLSTKRLGLFRLKPTKVKNSFKLENFAHNPSDIYSPANNDFYSVIQDKKGRIWAASYGGGLHLFDESTGKPRFIHNQNKLKSYPIDNCSKVRQVFADSKNRIWVATTEGFIVFDADFKSVENIEFKYYHKNETDPNSLGANDVLCIFEDDNSDMWLGTFGGGLNKLKTLNGKDNHADFEIFDRSKGFPNNIVYTIIDDKIGNLWLTTENSIVRFNKKSTKVEVFGRGNELENVEFPEASACLLQSGEICAGSKSGFYLFNPEAVKRRVIDAPLVFTGLSLFNKEVEIGGKESILQTHIDKTSKIVFKHYQNVFTIEFATLDMRAPDKIQYEYRLDGFDTQWNQVHKKHFATYTSLPPGNYTFHVRSTDSEGVWLNNERQIELKVLPSFWQSVPAKFLYVIFIVLLLIIVFYIFITIFKLKNNVALEKQITEMKLRFFTDISHELRTPLTLISLPIDNILQEKLDPLIKEQLILARRNLDRVLGLINQILDFRKIQHNKMRLTVEEVNFGEFVKSSSSNFYEIANNKGIQFDIVNDSNDVKIWVDPERFESIIYNLLSNAFKFTASGKNIKVITKVEKDSAVLYIIDQGVGIAKEKLGFIFDRFFSVSTLKNITQKSTGIGLDLVKNLVKLHHGEIQVESEVGVGSTFRIEFKLGVSHFDENADIIISDQKVPENKIENELFQEVERVEEQPEKKKPLILLVEDNEELRHFLKSSLKTNYRVEEAENGVEGWKKTDKLMPDFIITDLKMPEMDGLELTKKVKEDSRTSHIPIILLTAVTDMESKLAGMKVGADDYITKPFSSEFLHARVENLIAQRNQLQEYYRMQISGLKTEINLPPLEIKSQEDLFMQKLLKLMNDNIDNFELNIDYLATELGLSRTVFFNKLKSLTGYSPVEFVREVRFERAAEYIRSTHLTVSEISYQVGIEDPRYFSRCFKQKFGLTPSEYRLQNEN
ncbi:MAG: two-component regulator propeller domain-containing protein [Paludibacter sp.]|nr:two-component regulator propeller domain-containing protein [Paludibacter sp.]